MRTLDFRMRPSHGLLLIRTLDFRMRPQSWAPVNEDLPTYRVEYGYQQIYGMLAIILVVDNTHPYIIWIIRFKLNTGSV
jgi:hypothetical protein